MESVESDGRMQNRRQRLGKQGDGLEPFTSKFEGPTLYDSRVMGRLWDPRCFWSSLA